MPKRICLLLLLAAVPAFAQVDAFNGFCTNGGKSAVVQGLSSSNKLEQIIPSCTVTVYLTGTTTLATIYKDSVSTPLSNPFTADNLSAVAPGKWLFWAATGIGYDVTMSGGIAPNIYLLPVTLTDLKVGGGGGSNFFAQVNGVNLLAPGSINLVNSASVTFANISGTTVQATSTGGGSSGCTGTIVGDNTSTDCGYQNLLNSTTTPPASTSTFGYQNLNTNASTNMVAIGNQNGLSTLNFSGDTVAIGDQNAQYLNSAGESVSIGDHNLVGTLLNPCRLSPSLSVGSYNLNPCPAGTEDSDAGDVFAFGDSNLDFAGYTASSFRLGDILAIGFNNFIPTQTSVELALGSALCIGNDNCQNIAGNFSSLPGSDLVAIGDSNLVGALNNTSAFDEVVAIGESNAVALPATTSNIVGIGNSSGVGPCATVGGRPGCDPTTGTTQETVGIGDSSGLGFGVDIVAIGDGSVDALVSTEWNTGHDLVGIGNHACVENTTGTDNVCIGDYAGSIGASSGVAGNANKTGSHNVWIGDTAGPNTTTQLSNTIGIGYQAYNTASNQTVIGNSSITSLKLYGCSAGQVALNDGSGTCVAPGFTSPLTNKGDIFVYSSANDREPVGTNGQVLSADSTQTTGLKWISAFTNPMTTLGDTVYGGAAGAVTRLAGSTSASTLCLTQTGTGTLSAAPVWGSCAGSAATALSSITAATVANTAASGNNPITWNWTQTTASQTAFTFGETSAAIGAGDHEVDIKTVAGSTSIPLTVSQSLNSAQTIPAFEILPTWNTAGVVDAALLVNVTNTASGAASKLFDLQVGGVSQMAVDKAGLITNATWNGATIAVNYGGTGATTLTGLLKGNGTSAFSAAASADVYGLWSGTCNSTTFLRGDGSCQTPAGTAPSFSTITTGSNTSAAMTVGTGATLTFSGSGIVNANQVNGAVVPTSAGFLASNGSNQLVAAAYTPAHAGANSDITSLTGLTTPLSVPQGGTGAATLTGYVKGNGTSAMTASATVPGSDVSGNIPGSAANLYGAPVLPNGTSATTQAAGDNSAKLATTAYVAAPGAISPTVIAMAGTGPSTVQIPPGHYAALIAAYPCNSGNAGRHATVDDSTTVTWGAAISGGGSNMVGAVCNGSAYTVEWK